MKLLDKLFRIKIVEPEEPQVKFIVNTTGVAEMASKVETLLAFIDLLDKKETERTADENALCDLHFEFFDKWCSDEMSDDDYYRLDDEIMDVFAQLR